MGKSRQDALRAGWLVLLGLGVVTLWRSRKTDGPAWWRWLRRGLLAVAAFVVAQVVLFPTSVAYVVTHAARAYVPAPNLGASYEEVSFTTSDGLRLRGWYIPSKNGAAVISFPGRSSSQTRAKMLARHGYGVLLFDRRGEGESDGDPNLFGWQGERDVHAAVAYLRSRREVDPERIGGIGLSVGGEMMIEAAAESAKLKAIVSEGGSGRSVRDVLANQGMSWTEVIGKGVATEAKGAAEALQATVKHAETTLSAAQKATEAFAAAGEKWQPALQTLLDIPPRRNRRPPRGRTRTSRTS